MTTTELLIQETNRLCNEVDEFKTQQERDLDHMAQILHQLTLQPKPETV